MARQRHPGEPIADLHRRYEAGGARRPRGAAAGRRGPDHPYWGMGLPDTPRGGRGFQAAAPTLVDMEENAVSRFAATFVTDTTNPPAPCRWACSAMTDAEPVARGLETAWPRMAADRNDPLADAM